MVKKILIDLLQKHLLTTIERLVRCSNPHVCLIRCGSALRSALHSLLKDVFVRGLILFFVFGLFSCAKTVDDPLIIPPNFAEMPDPTKPEQPPAHQAEEDVERLKELLLKSDE